MTAPVRIARAFALVAVVIAAMPGTADATARLWLYPDSDDPNAGGHVVTDPAFTLNIENRGTGNGDNTAYDAVLLVAVNDPSLFVDASIVLPGGTVTVDPAMLVVGTPTFDCGGGTVPPHGVYPSNVAEIAVGDIAAGEIVAAGVVVNGDDGLEVHFDVKAVSYRQAGPNLRCVDVFNPSGHDVTVRFEGGGGNPCFELAVSKTPGATGVALNDPMDYVIVVENVGTCELTDVQLIEDLPTVPDPSGGDPGPAFSVTAIDPAPTSQSDTEIVWSLGTLDSGAAIQVTVSVIFDQPDAAGLEIVNTACATSAEVPDPECASATVTVGNPDDDELGGPGFWCNQLRFAREGRPNAMFTPAEIEAWLLEIFDASAVFPELWPLVTELDAEQLLCRPSAANTMADRLARHLLALWFNVVSERLPVETLLGELCPGDEDPPPEMDPEMTVEALLAAVEDDLVAGAGAEDLGVWLEIVDYVNNSRLPGPGGCDGELVRRSGSGRGRHGGHRP